jgi:hypothetical protein
MAALFDRKLPIWALLTSSFRRLVAGPDRAEECVNRPGDLDYRSCFLEHCCYVKYNTQTIIVVSRYRIRVECCRIIGQPFAIAAALRTWNRAFKMSPDRLWLGLIIAVGSSMRRVALRGPGAVYTR